MYLICQNISVYEVIQNAIYQFNCHIVSLPQNVICFTAYLRADFRLSVLQLFYNFLLGDSLNLNVIRQLFEKVFKICKK